MTTAVSDPVRHYARLARRRYDLRRKLDAVEREMAAIEPEVREDAGLVAGTIDDGGVAAHGMQLKLAHEWTVKANVNTASLVAGLRRARKPELIGVNWPALISYCQARPNALPKSLAPLLSVEGRHKVVARRVLKARRKGGRAK